MPFIERATMAHQRNPRRITVTKLFDEVNRAL
jgi:hypothetical protein